MNINAHDKTAGLSVRLLLVLSVLIATSCATYPERYSSDECLVVIKAVLVNPDGLPQGRNYYFMLSNGESTKSISGGYLAFKTQGPEVKLVGIASSVSSEYTGNSSRNEIEIPLPYSPGEVVVADFVFVHDFRRQDSSTVVSSFKFRRIESGEASALINALREKKEYASWWSLP